MGCDGCELWSKKNKTCYAGQLHLLRGGKNPGFAPRFEDVTTFPGRMRTAARLPDLRDRVRLDKPWLDGSPRLIFVSDMGDALSQGVSFDYLLGEIVDVARTPHGRRHRWLWLTKQPKRMAAFSRWLLRSGVTWPSNLWAGTSVTSKKRVDRVGHLCEVGDETTVRFLSVEPQWEDVNLSAWLSKVDWCIQGGESGPTARPFNLAWARSLRAQCRAARIPFFLKQLGARPVEAGKPVGLKNSHGGNWDEWPPTLRIREVPTVRAPWARWRSGSSRRRSDVLACSRSWCDRHSS